MSNFMTGLVLFAWIYFLIGFWIAVHEEEIGYIVIWGPCVLRVCLRSCVKIWREH